MTTKCCACGNPKTYGVWGFGLCSQCTAEWDCAAPTPEAIREKYPNPSDEMQVYKRWTAAWVAKRQAALKTTNSTGVRQ